MLTSQGPSQSDLIAQAQQERERAQLAEVLRLGLMLGLARLAEPQRQTLAETLNRTQIEGPQSCPGCGHARGAKREAARP